MPQAKIAVLAKTTRNAMIGFVVLGYAIYWASKGQADELKVSAFLWQKFPKFVLGFLLISVLATLGFFNKEQIGALANLSRWAFLLTFAGVGLRTNLRTRSKGCVRLPWAQSGKSSLRSSRSEWCWERNAYFISDDERLLRLCFAAIA